MKEKAIFIGTNWSYGFVTGREYEVTVKIRGDRITVDGIPYDTVCAMNKNWKFIGV